MKITSASLPVLGLLRGGGLNRSVRGWDRVIRRLYPLSHQGEGFVDVEYHGTRYRAAPLQYVDWQVLTAGAYELDDLDVFAALARHLPAPTVLDIGANVGHHAFFFATLGAEVHAFEPNPALWRYVEAKVQAAGHRSVHIHRVGLSDRNAALAYRTPDRQNSGTGQFVEGGAADEAMTLPVRHGDEYLNEIGISKIDMIKVDVQGFEPQVLSGLRNSIGRDRPVVCVEIGSENRDTIASLEALAGMLPPDYVFYRISYRFRGPFRSPYVSVLDEKSFRTFDGNLFCLPRERECWLTSR